MLMVNAHSHHHTHGHGHDRCLAHDHSRHDNSIPVDEGKNMITSHRWPSFMRTLPITPNQEGCPLIPQFSMGVIMGSLFGRAPAICSTGFWFRELSEDSAMVQCVGLWEVFSISQVARVTVLIASFVTLCSIPSRNFLLYGEN